MAINYPGPQEVEYQVQVSTFVHRIRLSCAIDGSVPTPGTPPASINLMTRSGAPAALSVCANGLWEQLRTFFNTSVSCLGYTLWNYPVAGSLAKDFVTSGTVTNAAGLSATASNLAFQCTLSFRSANGGVLKLTLLESVYTDKFSLPLIANAAGSTPQKVAAYMISSAGWAIARDDGFPVVPTKITGGENEVIARKRYRTT